MVCKFFCCLIKGDNQQNYKIKKIKFKSIRINMFFELINKSIIDLYCNKGNSIYSMAVIKRLRDKYNIKLIEILIRGDEHKSGNKSKELDDIIEEVINNDKYFKTIKVIRKNELLKDKFEKERHIHICILIHFLL